MNTQDVSALITSLGFPIVAYLLMFWHMNTTQKEMTKAINQNTEVIGKLYENLEKRTEKI